MKIMSDSYYSINPSYKMREDLKKQYMAEGDSYKEARRKVSKWYKQVADLVPKRNHPTFESALAYLNSLGLSGEYTECYDINETCSLDLSEFGL